MPLLNGRFDHWDDTTSVTAANFIAIVWSLVTLGTGGSPAATVNRQTFVAGAAVAGSGDGDPEGNLFYFLRWNQTALASTTKPELQNRIEKVRTFAGKKVVVQGWYRANQQIQIGLRQNFGSGGSPTTTVDTGLVNLPATVDAAGTTQWRRFAKDIYLPPLPASYVLGTTVDTDYLAVRFLGPLSLLFQYDLADVKLSESTNAIAVPRSRPGWYEKALLERYYVSLTAYAPVSTQSSGWVSFRRQMRAVPTMTGGTGSTLGTATVDGFPIVSTGAAGPITGILADARL